MVGCVTYSYKREWGDTENISAFRVNSESGKIVASGFFTMNRQKRWRGSRLFVERFVIIGKFSLRYDICVIIFRY